MTSCVGCVAERVVKNTISVKMIGHVFVLIGDEALAQLQPIDDGLWQHLFEQMLTSS